MKCSLPDRHMAFLQVCECSSCAAGKQTHSQMPTHKFYTWLHKKWTSHETIKNKHPSILLTLACIFTGLKKIKAQIYNIHQVL